MKRSYLLLIFTIILSNNTKAQVIANGLPGCLDPTLFKEGTLFCGGGSSSVFDIVASQFVVNNVDGIMCCPGTVIGGDNESYFQFGPIDISQFTNVSISCNYTSSATGYEDDFPLAPHFGCTGNATDYSHDQILFTYILDGVPMSDLYVHGTTQADFTGAWNTGSVINGNSLIIKIFAANKASAEIFYFSNLLVQGTPIITAGPDLSACTGGTVSLQGSGVGIWTGGLGTFSNSNSPTSTYTIDPSETSNVTLTYTTIPVLAGCPTSSDNMVIMISNPMGMLSGGGVLCPGECADVNVSFTGGTEPYTLGMQFSSPSIPFPFPFTIPGFMVNEVITVCYSSSGVIPSFNAATNTLTLPVIVGGFSGDLTLISLSDASGCNNVPQNSNVNFTFLLKPIGLTATLEACDEGNGDGVFDFTTLESTILNGNGGFVTFYEEMTLITSMSPPYIGPSTTIYAQITDANGCLSDPIPIQLEVLLSGDAGDIFFTCDGGFTSCFVCDSDGLPGEDIGLDISFSNSTRDYIVEIFYTINGVSNTYIGPISGFGGTINFNITGDAFFTIVAVTPDNECTDITDLPPSVSFNYEIQPNIFPIGPFNSCNPVILPNISGTNGTGAGFYNTQPDGSGINYNEGDVISSSITLYAIDGYLPDCIDVEPVQIIIGGTTTLLTPPNDTLCGYYIFPMIPGQGMGSTAGYYTGLGGTGINYEKGDTLRISDTIYVFDPSSNCPTNEPSFSILLSGEITYDSIGVFSSCNLVKLPVIKGMGMTDSVRYYTSPNGMGTEYLVGDSIYISDTLYVFDKNTLCYQDTTPVIILIGVGTTYDTPSPINQCGNFVLTNITGINIGPNAMYFTAPNGGGQGYFSGDTIKSSTTLFVFDTTSQCNVNQPTFEITLSIQPIFNQPSTIQTCGSYTLPPISGSNLTGNENYYSQPLGTGSVIASGTVINTDTTIYIYDGTGPCPTEKVITITFEDLNSGSPENFGLCSSSGSINLFDHLLPPYNLGGEWSEQATAFFDVTNPMNVVVPSNVPPGTYRFQYVVSSPECGIRASVLRIEIITSPIASKDTIVNVCLGEPSLDLSQYITTNGMATNYRYLNGALSFTGPIADIKNLPIGQHLFTVKTSNLNTSFNVLCVDSAQLTLNILDNPSAGDDAQGNYCIGTTIDISSLLANNDAVGTYTYLANPSILNGSLFNTSSLSQGSFDILHILDGQGNCIADTATITINLTSTIDAGLNVNAAECGIGTYDLLDYISTNDKSGIFEIKSGSYVISGNMIIADTPGNVKVNYILGDGVTCPRDTAEINLTIFAITTTPFSDQTCDAMYTYKGTTFTPNNNKQIVKLKNFVGCDSLIDVTITFSTSVIQPVNSTICVGDSIQINGKFYKEGKLTALDTLFGMASGGCDSILNINVLLEQTASSSVDLTTCDESYTLVVGNDTYDILKPTGTTILDNASANGCDSIVIVNLIIEPFSFEYDIIQPECIEDEGLFILTTLSGNDSVRLKSNGIDQFYSKTDLPISLNFQTGNFDLEISTPSGNCSDMVSFEIMDAIIPTIAIVATPLTDSTWQLSLESDTEITTYFWTSSGGAIDCWDCPDPILTGNGEVVVIYDYGTTCVGNTFIFLESDKDNTFHLPNIISANNDGINDDFTIYVSDDNDLKIESFVMLDRWGNVMASIKNQKPMNGDVLWNGKFNNALVNTGVYIYVLQIDINGEKKLIKGDLTIIR